MTTTAQDLATRAAALLNDTGNTAATVAANTRWPVSELLLWVTDAQREAVIISPNCNAIVTKVALVAGTRQSIPADGWTLLSIKRNVSSTGAGGRVITQVAQMTLDRFNPNWHTDTAAAVAENYTWDVEDRKAFYVYPPNDGTGYVELNYAQVPVAVTTVTQAITLDDSYVPALTNYLCYRALLKDAEYSGGASLAAQFYQAFVAAISEQASSERADTPNTTFATAAPRIPAAVPPPQGRK